MKCLSCGEEKARLYTFEAFYHGEFTTTKRQMCWDCLNQMELIVTGAAADMARSWKDAGKWK